jgi:hypothetical protein
MKKAARNYSRALAAMAKLTGLEPKKLVDAEAGIILKTCAAKTKVATAAVVQTGARVRALRGSGLTSGKITINAGARAPFGRVWWRNPETGKWVLIFGDAFSKMPRHINDPAFADVRQTVATARQKMGRAVKLAKASAALARGSWVMIADKLGIKLENVQGGGSLAASSITKARAAKARGNKQTANAAAKREESKRLYVLTLINRLPYGRFLGFDRLLTVTIAGRAKFFATAVKKGFDGSLKQTAKLFPGWTVK